MNKGKPTEGIEFYNLLFKNNEFSTELGKVTLAAGRLEAEIIFYFIQKGIKNNFSRSPLGKLIDIGNKNNLFDDNLAEALKMVCKQRNYLIHNIYSLFINRIDETILERSNLLDSDVQTYIERAQQLKENLIGLANIIRKK